MAIEIEGRDVGTVAALLLLFIGEGVDVQPIGGNRVAVPDDTDPVLLWEASHIDGATVHVTFVIPEASSAPEPVETVEDRYGDWTQPELAAEVRRRNSGRDDDERIRPSSQRRDDLVDALESDDQEE